MPFTNAGLNNPFDVDTFSLHASNPGVGVNPAAGELSVAPYARQAATFGAPVNGVAALSADVVFNLSTASDQACQFVGLWKAGVYKGYFIPDAPYTFTSAATSRSFTLEADTTTLNIQNPV